MHTLLPNESDYEKYIEIMQIPPVNSIRCNTIKISIEALKKRLHEKGWKIEQPWKSNPEVMLITSDLMPGELGRSLEHLLGYYYVQELSSMLPIIALKPKPNELLLDICSSPGSKTTQAAAEMNNTGTIIANDLNIPRIQILASNLERCGVTNTVITRTDGVFLCQKLKSLNYKFDKILIDAPCSGEGTLRSTPKTALMWNPHTIHSLSKLQKKLVRATIEILKVGGEFVYSTCTHAPEENEAVISTILNEFPNIKIEKIILPINCRPGITKWNEEEYSKEVTQACRIYTQDNNTEGFFLAKFKKIK
jgi:NOL1/NOP2/sun family putative RNA methylase